ncbi:MAG: PRC-barrel domain-containing protein [bacterium]
MSRPLKKNQLISLPVETKNGQSLGHIRDFEFDPIRQQIIRYYIKSGRLITELLSRELVILASQVISITEEKMVVDNSIVAEKTEPADSRVPASST